MKNTSNSKLAYLLYSLTRDYIPVGTIEKLIKESEQYIEEHENIIYSVEDLLNICLKWEARINSTKKTE